MLQTTELTEHGIHSITPRSMKKQHHYQTTIHWTGNRGVGTAGYTSYGREHTISITGKAEILSSSDPAFRGDPARHNPEELLVSALSACHMLWYLHLCAEAGIIVTAYSDTASGIMAESTNGGGHFESVTLHPQVSVAPGTDMALATSLHQLARERCFIANSVNFPVHHQPVLQSG
jgi:organic hydroperoxide reductase OsmC/OhrA